MKFFTLVSTLASLALSAAAPGIASYNLQAVSKGAAFDGQLLTINQGGVVSFNTSTTPARFYTANGSGTSAYSLHGYPIGIIDTPGVLVGSTTYKFVFTSTPQSTAQGATLLQDGWTFGATNPSIKSAPATGKYLGYNGESRWVAFPTGAGWELKWWDGTCCVTFDYVPLKLKLVAAKTT